MDTLLADCLADVDPLWSVLMSSQTERQDQSGTEAQDELQLLGTGEDDLHHDASQLHEQRRNTATRLHQPDTGNRDQAASASQSLEDLPDSSPQRDTTSPRQSPRNPHVRPSSTGSGSPEAAVADQTAAVAPLAPESENTDTEAQHDTDPPTTAAMPEDHHMAEQPQSLEDTDEDLLLLLQDPDAPSCAETTHHTTTPHPPHHQSPVIVRKRLSRLIRKDDVSVPKPSTPSNLINSSRPAEAGEGANSQPPHDSSSNDLEDKEVRDGSSEPAKKKARQDRQQQQQRKQQGEEQELEDDVGGDGLHAEIGSPMDDGEAAEDDTADEAPPQMKSDHQLIYGDSDDEEGSDSGAPGTAAAGECSTRQARLQKRVRNRLVVVSFSCGDFVLVN